MDLNCALYLRSKEEVGRAPCNSVFIYDYLNAMFHELFI